MVRIRFVMVAFSFRSGRSSRGAGFQILPPLVFWKQKKYRDFSRYLMVAGAGFEPYDLRVMSPMSYQTALPRDKALACASVFWCLYMIHHTLPFVKGFCQTIALFFAQSLSICADICTFCPLPIQTTFRIWSFRVATKWLQTINIYVIINML